MDDDILSFIEPDDYEAFRRIIDRNFPATYDEMFSVAVGSLDRPEDVQPECHTNTGAWLPWIKMDDDLPRLEANH